jgi:uncharacterized protein (DUF1786 family)
MSTQKQHAEMNDGPEAFERFRNAMKKIISVPKSSVLSDSKSRKAKRAKTSPASRVSTGHASKS